MPLSRATGGWCFENWQSVAFGPYEIPVPVSLSFFPVSWVLLHILELPLIQYQCRDEPRNADLNVKNIFRTVFVHSVEGTTNQWPWSFRTQTRPMLTTVSVLSWKIPAACTVSWRMAPLRGIPRGSITTRPAGNTPQPMARDPQVLPFWRELFVCCGSNKDFHVLFSTATQCWHSTVYQHSHHSTGICQ